MLFCGISRFVKGPLSTAVFAGDKGPTAPKPVEPQRKGTAMHRSTRASFVSMFALAVAFVLLGFTADRAQASRPSAELDTDGETEKVNYTFQTTDKYYRAMVILKEDKGNYTDKHAHTDDGTGSTSDAFTGLVSGAKDYTLILRVQWKASETWRVMDTRTVSTR